MLHVNNVDIVPEPHKRVYLELLEASRRYIKERNGEYPNETDRLYASLLLLIEAKDGSLE